MKESQDGPGRRRSMPDRIPALRLRPRSSLAIVLASLIGLAAFCWPLLASADSAVARRSDAPWLFALLLPVVVAIVLAEVSEAGMDSKAVAMLGVLSAAGAAARVMGAGTAGIETVFFLIVLSGRAFGPGFGFVLGHTALFTSAVLTGGVGPWLPYQMLASGWVGMGAGLLPPLRGRAEVAMLAVYGAMSALAYGFLLNLSFWPFALGGGTSVSFVPGDSVSVNLRRLAAFTLATSMGWDVGRAITTSLLVLLTGSVLLRTFRRAGRRAVFEAQATFEPPTGGTALAALASTRRDRRSRAGDVRSDAVPSAGPSA